jgi:hypothetical protein
MESGANHAWGVTRVPAVPGHEVVDSYGGGLGILHESEETDLAAWRFIRWLTEPEQTARWAARSGYFPVRISAGTHPSVTQKLAEDPQYAQAYALLPLGRGEPGVRGYNDIRGILNDAMTEILQNGADVNETLRAAADEADAILAASGPDSAIIPPGGGTLVYTNTQYLSATVEFPAGALATTQTVSYVPLDDLPTDGLAFALVPNMTFSRPVTITIYYRDEDVAGMDETRLKLYNYDWSSGSWIEADPCGGYVTDTVNNILQAAVCHFSDYAMMDWPYGVSLYVAITGTDSGNCSTPVSACLTIQYAVDQASEGDEIRVASGSYTGVSVRPRADVTTTGVVTQVVYISKTVAIRGGYTTTNNFADPPDPVANPTTLDAQKQGRVLYITGDPSVGSGQAIVGYTSSLPRLPSGTTRCPTTQLTMAVGYTCTAVPPRSVVTSSLPTLLTPAAGCACSGATLCSAVTPSPTIPPTGAAVGCICCPATLHSAVTPSPPTPVAGCNWPEVMLRSAATPSPPTPVEG